MNNACKKLQDARIFIVDTDSDYERRNIPLRFMYGLGHMEFVEPNFIYTVAQNRLLYGTHLIKIDTKFNRKYRVGLLEPWGYKFVEPNFLYVSDPPNNRLYVLDTRTDAIIDSVTTGPYPTEIISGE